MIAHRDPTTPPPGYRGRPRNSPWVQTYLGNVVWPLDSDPEDIDIRDVAHHLSNTCRFSGAPTETYSVAEHSVRVSEIVPYEDKLWALLHDSAEFVLKDLPSPIKHTPEMAPYRAWEKELLHVILDKYGLPHEKPASVAEADLILQETERRDLMLGAELWTTGATPLPNRIYPWWPKDAEHRFLKIFERLDKDRRLR